MRSRKPLLVSLLFILFLLSLSGASAIITGLQYPQGQVAATTGCGPGDTSSYCVLNTQEASKICDQEGQYKWINSDGSRTNAYAVNYDTGTYCRGLGDPNPCVTTTDTEYRGGACTSGQNCVVTSYSEWFSSCENRYPYSSTIGGGGATAAFMEPYLSNGLAYATRGCGPPSASCPATQWTTALASQWQSMSYSTAASQNICPYTHQPTYITWKGNTRFPSCGAGLYCYFFYTATQQCTPTTTCGTGKCCGARPDLNCGVTLNKDICMQTGSTVWEWGNKTKDAGQIFQLTCANATVVSNTTDFLACGDTRMLKTNPALATPATTLVQRGDEPAHGYLCAELNSKNAQEQKGWIECTANNVAYDKRMPARHASAGTQLSPNLLYQTDADGAQAVTLPALNNFNPSAGRIELTIEQHWAGTDPVTRTFLSIDDDPQGYGNALRIRKVGSSIECRYNATNQIVQFDIGASEPGDITEVLATWDIATGFTCTVNGVSKNLPVRASIAAQTITLANKPNLGEPANAALNLTLYDKTTPDLYYCSSDGQFRKDLDYIAPEVGGPTCGGAGQLWTGKLCCSELEDQPSEYYNDNNGTGACWASRGSVNGAPIASENNKLISVEGNWFSCNLPSTDPRLAKTDTHTGALLVKNNNTCEAFRNIDDSPNTNYVCSVNNLGWIKSPSVLRHELKQAPYVTPLQQECCGIDSCWNGTQCIGNQRNEPTDTTYEGYRCVDGTWTTSPLKKTWDRRNKGYCPQDADCLVHPAGRGDYNYNTSLYLIDTPTESPACIAQGQSLLGYTCSAGTWTTKTKYLALQLLDFAQSNSPDDYALFCDDWTELLNFVDYESLPNAGNVQNYVNSGCTLNGKPVPCVNQFCALKYQNSGREYVAFGTTLNANISHPSKSFLTALGLPKTACDPVINGDDDYDACAPVAPNVYYNHNTTSLIFLPMGTLSSKTRATLSNQHEALLTTPHEATSTFFMNRPLVKEKYGFLAASSLYDRIFLFHKGTRNYFGYFGYKQYNGTYQNYITVRHQNFNVQDPDGRTGCDMAYARVPTDLPRDCDYASNTLQFVAYATSSGNTLRTAWRDFTAKLRIP